jgi:hypothetical protein
MSTGVIAFLRVWREARILRATWAFIKKIHSECFGSRDPETSQYFPSAVILRIQFERFPIVENGIRLVAQLQFRFPERVVNIPFSGKLLLLLRDLDRIHQRIVVNWLKLDFYDTVVPAEVLSRIPRSRES